MNFQQLRYFIVVAEYLNFTKAAERLYITQPGLSRHISNLEQELGVILFNRDTHSVSLTDAGRLLLSEAYPMIRSHERLLSILRERSHNGKSKLTIGYNGWLEPSYFPQFLKLFVLHNPNIDIYLRKSNLIENIELVKNYGIDLMLGLFSGRENLTGLCKKNIAPIDTVFVTNSEHPLAERASVTLPEIKDEEFIALSREMRPFAIDMFNTYFTDRGVLANVVRHVDDRMDYFTLIEAGVGVGLTCSLYASPEPDNPELASIPVSDHEVLYYCAVWNEANSSPAIAVFCNQVAEYITDRRL